MSRRTKVLVLAAGAIAVSGVTLVIVMTHRSPTTSTSDSSDRSLPTAEAHRPSAVAPSPTASSSVSSASSAPDVPRAPTAKEVLEQEVRDLVTAEAASLTSTATDFDNLFAPDAVALFPYALGPVEGRDAIAREARAEFPAGAFVQTAAISVGVTGALAWATTTWHVTRADTGAVVPVRVSEVFRQDTTRLVVIAASFSVAEHTVKDPGPIPTLVGEPAGEPETWLASPADVATHLRDDPATSLIGADLHEVAVGTDAVRRLLTSWSSVRLEIVGNVRVIDGAGYRIALMFARWRSPKQTTVFRVLGLFVPSTSGTWEVATVNYSVAVPAPTSIATPSAPVTPSGTSCPSGMTPVARDSFSMGTPDGLGEANEHPAHRVTVSAFCIDTTEVTAAAYASCVTSGQCSPAGTGGSCNAGRPDRQEHPINCVSWDQAVAFCATTGKRLPTEAEWEYAARGTDGREFAWGSDLPKAQRLNACGGECTAKAPERLFTDSDGWPETAPVGSYRAGASASGALDMAGNVWEWTADWMGPYSADPAVDPSGPASGKGRVYRGGGWGSRDVGSVRAARRRADLPSASDDSLGFRCAWKMATVPAPSAATAPTSSSTPSCSFTALNCQQFSTQGRTGRKLHELVFAAEQAGRHAEAVCLAQSNLTSSDLWLAGAANYDASRAWEGLGCHDQAVAAIEASLAVRPREQSGWKETCQQCQKIGGTCALCNATTAVTSTGNVGAAPVDPYATPAAAPDCSQKVVDPKNTACRTQFCQAHKDDARCEAE